MYKDTSAAATLATTRQKVGNSVDLCRQHELRDGIVNLVQIKKEQSISVCTTEPIAHMYSAADDNDDDDKKANMCAISVWTIQEQKTKLIHHFVWGKSIMYGPVCWRQILGIVSSFYSYSGFISKLELKS
jgi:hypothetical protein